MKKNKLIYFSLLFLMFSEKSATAQDWAEINHYKNENIKLGLPIQGENRVVFMGNSITEFWSQVYPPFFAGKPYINRGIKGQTSPQMLLRFRTDVIELKPAVVVILAGTNDIAGITGPTTLEAILGNIISMAELAIANNIKVVLCSVLPVYEYNWKPDIFPAEKIVLLNEMIKKYAEKNGIVFIDYHSSMKNERKGMKAELTADGVHPNEEGYKVMSPLTENAIAKALIKE